MEKGNSLKILVPTPVFLNQRSFRIDYVNSILESMRKKIPTKIIWLVYQPDIVRTFNDSLSVVHDIHEFNDGVDVLKTLRPDCLLVNNSAELIQYSLSMAAKFLKIPLVSFYLDEHGVRRANYYNNLSDTTIALRNFFSSSVPTDSEEKKKFLKRGRFFAYKYSFLVKTRRSLKINYYKILKYLLEDFIIYISNKGLPQNKLSDFHLLPNEAWLTPLIKEGLNKEKLVVTGNPYWDKLYHKILEKKTQDRERNDKIRILLATDPLVEHGIWKAQERDSFLENLLRELKKDDNIFLSLKIHPSSESKIYYEKLLKRLKINTAVFQTEDTWNIINDYDIILSYGTSSLHTEIAVVGIKMIFLDFGFNFPMMPLVEEGIKSGHLKKCTELIDLLPMIHDFVKHEIILKDSFLKERERHFFKFDGKSGERAAKIILKIIDSSQKMGVNI